MYKISLFTLLSLVVTQAGYLHKEHMQYIKKMDSTKGTDFSFILRL